MSNERNDIKFLNLSSRDIVFGRATVVASSLNGRVGWALIGGRFTESQRVAEREAQQMNRLIALCKQNRPKPLDVPSFADMVHQ